MNPKDEIRDALLAEIMDAPLEELRRELSEAGLFGVDPCNAYPDAAARFTAPGALSSVNDGDEASGFRRPSRRFGRPSERDIPLPLAAAEKNRGEPPVAGGYGEFGSVAAGHEDQSAFVILAFTTDGGTALGYVRGAEDVVLVQGAEVGEYLVLGESRYELDSPDEAGFRVVKGLTQEGLGMWLVDTESGEEDDPKIL